MLISPQDRFYILDGVHRAMGMRMLGLKPIPARLFDDGVYLGQIFVGPDQLYSPKTSVNRWDRGRDFLDLLDILRTVRGRLQLGDIKVEWLGAAGQGPSVPLSQVAFVR